MSALESLPPDQKAVLQLLLKQGKSYADLSKLLRIEPDAVRERALDAMDALGPEEADGLDDSHQDQVADYLLGQSDPQATEETRTFLAGSPGGRAWARAVSAELQTLSPAGLPEIPEAASAPAAERGKPAWRRGAAAPGDAEHDPQDYDEPDHDRGVEQDASGARAAGGPRSSKLGGVLLLLGVAVLLGLVLFVALGKDDDEPARRQGSTPAVSTPAAGTSTPAGQPKVEQQINLTSAVEGSKALGVANVVSQGGRRAIALIGQGIKPAGRRYAVWLINDKTSQFLGFAPPVKADGRLQGLAGTPENLREFREIIVTRETIDRPKQPGTVVLRGPLREG